MPSGSSGRSIVTGASNTGTKPWRTKSLPSLRLTNTAKLAFCETCDFVGFSLRLAGVLMFGPPKGWASAARVAGSQIVGRCSGRERRICRSVALEIFPLLQRLEPGDLRGDHCRHHQPEYRVCSSAKTASDDTTAAASHRSARRRRERQDPSWSTARRQSHAPCGCSRSKAGWPGTTPSWVRNPVQVIRCMNGMGAPL